MLHAIRERATGWLAYLIVFLISIPFALWGINEYFGGGDRAEVATVNGEPISFTEFQRMYQSNLRARQPASGQSLEDLQKELREEILESLIRRHVLWQYMDEQGVQVTDAEVMQQIQQMEMFQDSDGGGFNPVRYQGILQANRITATEYEAEQRQRLRMALIENMLEASTFVTEASAKHFRALREQTRDFRYFSISLNRFLDRDAVTDAEIEAEYTHRQEAYTTAQRARVSYLEVSREQFEVTTDEDIAEEKVQRYYERQALEFMAPELRRVRQIFFKDEDAESSAQAVYEQLQAGGDFAQLARDKSQDPISQSRDGEIGWVAQEDLPEDLGLMIFEMDPGTVSTPLGTEQGTYLLEVLEIKEASLRELDEVRDQVMAKLRQQERDSRFTAALSDLAQLTYENPETLQIAADYLGLSIQDLGEVDLDALPEGVLTEERVAAELQEVDELLQQGENSDRIDVSEDHSVVLRLDDYAQPKVRALEEVSDQIRTQLAQQAARAALLAHASALTDRLRSEPDIAVLAQEEGAELIVREAVGREHKETPGLIMERAFSLARPRGEAANFGMAILPRHVAIIALDAVHHALAEQADEEDLELLRYYKWRDDTESLTTSLKKRATVESYPGRL